MRLYLASTSPARLATLRNAGVEPVLLNPGVDEDAVAAAAGPLTPHDYVQLLARAKAEAVVGSTVDGAPLDGFVLGGDSAFELDGVVYGKPHLPEVALERWRAHARPGRAAALRPLADRPPGRTDRARGRRRDDGRRDLRRRSTTTSSTRTSRPASRSRSPAGSRSTRAAGPSSSGSTATRTRWSGCPCPRCARSPRSSGWRGRCSGTAEPVSLRATRGAASFCEDRPKTRPVRPIGWGVMAPITKVLIANRGEIAVRVIRAAKDSGILSVAVYADQDRDARHVRLADEAYALEGTTSAETYLVIDKLLSVARRSGADAVHPGYGFLAENADFARAVIDAGLIWIGPSPEAIEKLGDKVSARHIAEKVGAPLAPGTLNPVSGRRGGARLRGCARPPGRDQGGVRRRRPWTQGRPHARGDPRAVRVRDARGHRGVRPRRVLRREVPRPAAPRRDAVPRGLRGQRRRDLDARLLAPAPPPEARGGGARPVPTDEQNALLYESSKAILKEVGYVGAGTCEFLIGKDGTVSFLEVNTRLQVEHPVSEEVTGIDLVREQFRIAEGGTHRLPRPGRARPLVRVPHQRRGPGPRLPALARTGERAAHARRPRRARRQRRHDGRRDQRRVRLAAGQAHRHGIEPRGCPRALAPGPRRVRGGRPADRAAVPPQDRARPRLHLVAVLASTPAGSRPTSSTTSSRGAARCPRARPGRCSGTASSSRSRASASRSACRPGSCRRPAASALATPPRRRTSGAVEHGHRRHGQGADAGDGREARRRRGRQGRQGRPDPRARGDEDGAADHRPQGRHRRRPQCRRSARPCRAVTCS